jgi:hypothetical protein
MNTLSRNAALLTLATVCLQTAGVRLMAFPEPTPDSMGKRMLDGWFERKVAEIEREGSLAVIKTREDFEAARAGWRRELESMLGLDPMPERTDLKPVVTGTVEAEGVVIENLHFQSMPGLYVTGNFYAPAGWHGEKLPTILYVCGHARVVEDGVAMGNKTAYHHHGLWFARNGYTCLIIDTLQLGEIAGEHHGTHNLGKWWWVSRGYTSAGVEAWNCIRALDYLETRPEVDTKRIGVTGRSGGGAYSWWVAALDDRIAAAAPTAGITDLRNHVVDGCVEGHCDCMYQLNTRRWDYDRVAALVAPRPLLICNTDKDRIFPLDGVVRLYQSTRRIYELAGETAKIGLHIAEGPHKDTQPLNTGAFHWFNRWLKGADLMDTTAMLAVKELTPSSLRVLAKGAPEDAINARIDHVFVPAAPPAEPPEDTGAWDGQRERWISFLGREVFDAWPDNVADPEVTKVSSVERDGVRMTTFDFESDKPFRLRLFVTHQDGLRPEEIELAVLNVLDEQGWEEFCNTHHSRFGGQIEIFPAVTHAEEDFQSVRKMLQSNKWAMIHFCPRGIGPTAWEGSPKAQTQRLRRFHLVGATLHSAQVWDIRQGVRALRQVAGFEKTRLWVQAARDQAANALFAALHSEGLERLDLHSPPVTLAENTPGLPHYQNVLKQLDMPEAAAMAAETARVVLYDTDEAAWARTAAILKVLGRQEALQIRGMPPAAQ